MHVLNEITHFDSRNPACVLSCAPILFALLKSFPALSKPCAALISSSITLPAPPTNWSRAQICTNAHLYLYQVMGPAIAA